MKAPYREIGWPIKLPVFGVGVSATTYEALAEVIVHTAAAGRSACITALAVHGLMTATRDPEYREILRTFDAVVPDGQPVRFAMNLLCDARLRDRVRAVELTLIVCEFAARARIKVYLYGSTADVVDAFRKALARRIPGLEIVGCEPGVYRPLTPPESSALADRINASGAGLMLIGLGCPHQERFAFLVRSHVAPVQLCIGAAFDFIAGTKPMAPPWMQRAGLEWLFRLVHEPRRLWRRYLDTNTRFIGRLVVSVIHGLLTPQRGRKS